MPQENAHAAAHIMDYDGGFVAIMDSNSSYKTG